MMLIPHHDHINDSKLFASVEVMLVPNRTDDDNFNW